MSGWTWGVIILIILILIVVMILRILAHKRINETVEIEINKILASLKYHNYTWNNSELYASLKNKVKECIMDNRKNWPTIATSYKNNSSWKMNEIKRIVQNFLKRDQN